MKNFVIGFLSFFDNDMKLFKVQSSSKEEALRSFAVNEFEECEDNLKNMSYEELLGYFFDSDSAINVIEI